MLHPDFSHMGVVVSKDPLIVWSSCVAETMLGYGSLFPEKLLNRPSLHLIGFPYSLERFDSVDGHPVLAGVVDAYKQAKKNWPLATFVYLAHTQYETLIAARYGLPVIQAHELIFTDETKFFPRLRTGQNIQMHDAVYNANFALRKRHELASSINSLLLIYGVNTHEPHHTFDEARSMLPNAKFLNHDLGNGEYQLIGAADQISEYLSYAHVGLSLAIEEAGMRAMMEYLLSGLPVVTVRGVSGRERFLSPEYAITADDNPDSVAAAVSELKARNINRVSLHKHIKKLLDFERRNFLFTVNRIVQKEIQSDFMLETVVPFFPGLRHRKLAEFEKDLEGL